MQRTPTITGPNEEILAILQTGLARLKRQNPLISIRALAARLELSPSYLSKVFRGERTLPLGLLHRLGPALQLDAHETVTIQKLLLASVEEGALKAATGVRLLRKENDEPRLATDYQTLSRRDYWLLDAWYHLPILNLVTTHNFDPSPEEISRRLRVGPRTVERSLERLFQEGYIAKNAEGRFVRTALKIRFPTDRSHESIRKFHRAALERAIAELEAVPSEQEFRERLLAGLIVAGDPAKIPEAKLVLEKAMYQAAEILSQSSGPGSITEIFQLGSQLLKLTRA